MQIKGVKGNLWSFGPKNSDVLIVWMRSGLNTLHSSYVTELEPELSRRHVDLLEVVPGRPEPFRESHRHRGFRPNYWASENPVILRVDPLIERARYIYFHPSGNGWVDSEEKIDQLVFQSLSAVNRLDGVTSCSFNGIWPGNTRRRKELDLAYAARMMVAARQWSEQHAETAMEVAYFVDKHEDFVSAANE